MLTSSLATGRVALPFINRHQPVWNCERGLIILTGSDDQSLAVAAMRGGAQDYLVKDRIDGNVLAQLRASASNRLRMLPAAALTAFVRPEDKAQAFKAGFQMPLEKPFVPATILSAVASLAMSPTIPAPDTPAAA